MKNFVENINYSKELEKTVLGAAMIEKDAFGRVYKIIDSDVFYYEGHGAMFQTLKNMWGNNEPIDMISV